MVLMTLSSQPEGPYFMQVGNCFELFVNSKHNKYDKRKTAEPTCILTQAARHSLLGKLHTNTWDAGRWKYLGDKMNATSRNPIWSIVLGCPGTSAVPSRADRGSVTKAAVWAGRVRSELPFPPSSGPSGRSARPGGLSGPRSLPRRHWETSSSPCNSEGRRPQPPP